MPEQDGIDIGTARRTQAEHMYWGFQRRKPGSNSFLLGLQVSWDDRIVTLWFGAFGVSFGRQLNFRRWVAAMRDYYAGNPTALAQLDGFERTRL